MIPRTVRYVLRDAGKAVEASCELTVDELHLLEKLVAWKLFEGVPGDSTAGETLKAISDKLGEIDIAADRCGGDVVIRVEVLDRAK